MAEHEYYMEDFPVYTELFKKHSLRTVELMRIVDEHLKTELNMVAARPKELYYMVNELIYKADKSYKKEKDIVDSDEFLIYRSLGEHAKEEMRTVFREEVQRYFGVKDD